MRKRFAVILISAVMSLSAFIFIIGNGAEMDTQSAEAPKWLVIEGLVENRLNLSYSELQGFLMISEVTMLQCVGGGQGGLGVTYNWTGVPLFQLLNMAKVIPGAYRKVVFNSTDGFSDSVTLQTAMEPTTLLGLKANGTDLEQIFGFGSGYRIILPCRWGYKWVKWVKQIIVVDYDYQGDYERLGLSDEALRPDCTMPTTNPAIHNFTVTYQRDYTIRALSNSTIDGFSFTPDRRLRFNLSGTEGTSGYLYVAVSRDLLSSPYQVYIDQQPISFSQTLTSTNVYLCVTYSHSSHTIEIEGTLPTSDGIGGGASSKRQLE